MITLVAQQNIKRSIKMRLSITLLFTTILTTLTFFTHAKSNIVTTHGNLSVKSGHIVDQKGQVVSLAGPSFFWSNTGWQGDKFYRASTVDYFINDWQASVVRAAIGFEAKGGLVSDKTNMERLTTIVDTAVAQGVYVIIDLHSHKAHEVQSEAISFFQKIARQYGHLPNVIYEIYNEPLRKTDWATVIKPYSEAVIKAIREIDPDNIIVVGSQSWSQDVDKAADNPIVGYSNIAYSLHFYAGTHKQSLRDKAQYAIDKGLAIMVTEWGTVNADGNGDVDRKESNLWLDFIRKNKLSHCNWSVTDKNEGSAIFKPGNHKKTIWKDTDLTESGLFVKNVIKNWSK